MFKSGVIRNRVMQVLNDHIDAAEREYEQETERLDDALIESLREVHEKHQQNKSALLEKIVSGIVAKFI